MTYQAAPEAPARVTLITGGEQFLVSRAVSRAVVAARAVHPDVERRDVDAADPAGSSALLSALSPSLFGESAVVVVGDLADASDAVVSALVAAATSLPEDMWVVAVHSGSRNRKVLDRVRAIGIPGVVQEVQCGEVKPGRPTRELLELEARRAGRRITPDGIDALVTAVGSKIGLLVGALEQLMADNPEGPLGASTVNSAFAGVAEVSGFQFADAVWEGRGLVAMQRLRWGLGAQTLNGVGAVGSLAAGLRSMVRVAGAPRGMTEADVAKFAGVPPFKVRHLRAEASAWEPAQLARAVVDLADVDARIKGGLRAGQSLENAQKVWVLESFVLKTVGRRERPAGARALK
ncbi:MAG: hypothetical protein WCF04_04945 [Candidatus Nanopelagicales bacterium]